MYFARQLTRLGFLILFVTQLSLQISPAVFAQSSEETEAEFQMEAQRYHSVLNRRPSRGTAFDWLYRHYLDADKLDQLVTHYEKEVEQNADDANRRIVLALIYERRAQLEDALAQFEKAAEIDEENYRPHLYRAQLLTRLHRDEEVIHAYREALKREPSRNDLVDIHKQLGRQLSQQGKTEEAIEVWNALVEIFPDDHFILEELAILLAEEEHYEKAVKRYEELVKVAERDLQTRLNARVAIGDIHVRQGETEAAIETFETALDSVKPDSWHARIIRDRIEKVFVRSGDATGVIGYYQTRLESHPTDFESMVRLASALRRVGKLQEAISQYRSVLELAPSRDDVTDELIGLLVEVGETDEAIRLAEKRVARTPEDIEAVTRLGQLYLDYSENKKQGEQQAGEVWAKIAEIRPDDPLLSVQTAELFRNAVGISSVFNVQGRENINADKAKSQLGQQALKFYKQAVDRSPQAPEYREYLGEYLWSTGKKAEAKQAWEKIATAPRDTVENLKRLAELYHSINEFDEAKRVVERAIEKSDRRYDLQEMAARIATAQGDFDKALNHVERMDDLADSYELEETALVQRVELLMQADRLNQQFAKLTQKISRENGTVRDYWLAGLMALSQRRMNESLAFFESALDLEPDHTLLLQTKAEVHERAGDLGGAAQQFQKLAEVDPRTRIQNLRRVVQLELQLGRIQQALETAERLVSLSPGNPEPLEILADVHFRAGNRQNGIDAIRRAIRQNPKDIDIRIGLANRLVDQTQFEEAIEHFWRAFEMAEDATTKRSLAGTLAEQYVIIDRFPDLVSRLKRLRQSRQDSYIATMCLAEAYLHAGDFASARDELNGLWNERPDDANVLSQLVLLSEQLDDTLSAAEYQEKLVELAPDRSQLERLADLYSQLGQTEKSTKIWQRMARAAQDRSGLLEVVKRAARNGMFDQIVTLLEPQKSAAQEDWLIDFYLMLAYWYNGHSDRSLKIAEDLLQSLPSEKRGQTQPMPPANSMGTARTSSRYPRLITRMQLPRQLSPVFNDRSGNRLVALLSNFPNELDEAQMAAALLVYSHAKEQQQEEEFLQKWQREAENNPARMKQLSWIYLSSGERAQDAEQLLPLLAKLIEHNPFDADARLALFAMPFMASGGPTGISEQQLNEIVDPQYKWFAEHRPQLNAFLAEPYLQTLVARNDTEKASELVRGIITDATSLTELEQASGVLQRLVATPKGVDTGLLGELLKKFHELKTLNRFTTSRLTASSILQMYVNLAQRQQDWQGVVSAFADFMAETHPQSVTKPVRLPRSNRPRQRSSSSLNAKNTAVYEFPRPTPWLDTERLALLNSVYSALDKAGQINLLTDFVAEQLKNDEGTAHGSWQLVDIVLKWKAGQIDVALKNLADFVADYPGHADLRLLQAAAYANQQQFDNALSVLNDVSIAFGERAKLLEQMRLEFATRAGETEAGKKAALRLFRMRLNAAEQFQLAAKMTQYGLGTHSRQLRDRAVRSAGSNLGQLYQLMRTSNDTERSLEIARLLVQRVPLSNKNDENRQYRRTALKLLQQHGELQPFIEKLERQFAAAPTSTKLITELLELHTVSGDREKIQSLLDRLGENPPSDATTAYNFAQMLLTNNKPDAAQEMLSVVWQKDPDVLLKNSSNTTSKFYPGTGGANALISHLNLVKGQVPQRYAYNLVNLIERLERTSPDVSHIKSLYTLALEKLPQGNVADGVEEYAEYLAGKKQYETLYKLYASFVLPTGQKFDSYQFARNQIQTRNGIHQTAFMDFVDNAHQYDNAKTLHESVTSASTQFPDWKPIGDLLLAMADRRAGVSSTLIALGNKCLTDDSFQKALTEAARTARTTLFEELAQAESQEAVRLAIRMKEEEKAWSPAATGYASNTRTGYAISTRAKRIAGLYMRIEEPENARNVLLDAAEFIAETSRRPMRVRGVVNSESSKVASLYAIAEALRSNGFHFDAIRMYQNSLDRAAALPVSDNTRRQTVPKIHKGISQSLNVLFAEEPKPLIDQLVAELNRDQPNVQIFFAVADDGSSQKGAKTASPIGGVVYENSEAASDEEASSTTPVLQSDSRFLLPTVLAAAKNANRYSNIKSLAESRLEKIDETTSAHQRRSLQALNDLLVLYEDDADAAKRVAEEWLQRTSTGKTDDTADGLTWTISDAALQRPETREIGQKLCMAVAQAAGKVSNNARQKAALNLVIQTTDENGVTDIFDKNQVSATLAYQVAMTFAGNKNYDEAISWLEQVWIKEPKTLVENIDKDLPNYYAQAKNLSALADGLRMVKDSQVIRSGSSDIARFFDNFASKNASKTEFADGIFEIYQVSHELLMQHNNGYTSYLNSQFKQYLDALPADISLRGYATAVLPQKNYRGEVELLDDWLNKAKAQQQLPKAKQAIEKAIEEKPTWKPVGEFGLALTELEQGNEQPLIDVAQKYRSDPGFAAAFSSIGETMLRSELTDCESREAAQLALDFWQNQLLQEQSNNRSSNTTATRNTADLYVKLGQREKAKELLLNALNQPLNLSSGNRDYKLRQEIEYKRYLSDGLVRADYHIEALKGYQQALQVDVSGVDANDYVHTVVRYVKERGYTAASEAASNHADRYIGQLVAELNRTDGKPDLSPYFAVFTNTSSSTPGSSSNANDGNSISLLPALVDRAKKKGKMSQLEEALDTAMQKYPEHSQLATLDLLVLLKQERADEANRQLQQLVDSLKKTPSQASQPHMPFLAQAAIKHKPTRKLGWSLAEAILHNAPISQSTGHSALLSTLVKSLTDAGDSGRAEQLMQEIIQSQVRSAVERVNLAQTLGNQDQIQMAIAVLQPAWKADATSVLKEIRKLAPLYAQANAMDQLTTGLASVTDSNLRTRYDHSVTFAARDLAREKGNFEEALKLFEAATKFAGTESERGTSYRYWAEALESQNRKEAAWKTYREGLFSSKGSVPVSYLADHWIDLSQDLNKLAELKSTTRQAVKSHPQWQPQADLIIAIAELREGNEQPLIEVAEKYSTNGQYSSALSSSSRFLREELPKVNSIKALKLAAELWEGYVRSYREGRSSSSYAHNYFASLAEVYQKLGDREKALAVFKEAENAPMPNYSSSAKAYYRFRRRQDLSKRMAQNDFPVQSLRLIHQNLALAGTPLISQRNLGDELEVSRQLIPAAVHDTITQHLAEATAELKQSLTQAGTNDLAMFLTVHPNSWTEDEIKEFPEYLQGPNASSLQLLPAIAAYAKKTGQLQALVDLATKMAQRRQSDPVAVAMRWQFQSALTGETPTFKDAIRLAQSEHPGVKEVGVLVLAEIATPESVDALWQAIDDSPRLMALVVPRFTMRDTAKAADALARLHGKSNRALVKAEIETALSAMSHSRATELFHMERVASDDFDKKPSIDWKIQNEKPELYSFKKEAGHVTITGRDTSFHGKNAEYENIFAIDLPAAKDHFEATVSFRNFYPQQAYQQADLIVWNDPDNYIKLSYECGTNPTRPKLAMIPEIDGQVTARQDRNVQFESDKIWIRVRKFHGRYLFSTSTDGKNFHTHGSVPWKGKSPQMIGFSATAPQAEPLDVSFDSFELRHPAGELYKWFSKKSQQK
jgi:tetratricopeptide (TPR) repeat protein